MSDNNIYYVSVREDILYEYDAFGPYSSLEKAQTEIAKRYGQEICGDYEVEYTDENFVTKALELIQSDYWDANTGDKQWFVILEINLDMLDKNVESD